MKYAVALVLAVLDLLWSPAFADDPNKDKGEAATLVGKYEIVAGERGGQKITGERLKEVMVRIAANAITTYDGEKKEVYAATYELDTSRKPWRISMTATLTPVDGKGTKAQGLIEMNGDTVKLIYALPGGKPPTEFATGEQQQMFVLKKTGK